MQIKGVSVLYQLPFYHIHVTNEATVNCIKHTDSWNDYSR